MRELLFRGFHPCDGPDTIVVDGEKVKGEWVYGYYAYMGPTGRENHYIAPEYASAFYGKEVLPSTVGQYTGLKDKNGKQIFEGDILQTETDYFGHHNVHKNPILWNDDIENDSFGEPFTCGYVIHGGNWVVIGTVFDEEALNET